jgi:outer membrane protein TolC
MSTSFLVIQAQRDLAVARDNELRALLDYQLAAVTFERVQQVGGSPVAVPTSIGTAGGGQPRF